MWATGISRAASSPAARLGEHTLWSPKKRPGSSSDGFVATAMACASCGEVVAVQGDRALGTRGDMLVPFFGAPAPFPLGPFLLAGAVGVPVVPAFCLLDPEHRYLVKVAEPLEVARGGAEDAARRWVAILEETVREHPTQWFNFFDIWSPWSS